MAGERWCWRNLAGESRGVGSNDEEREVSNNDSGSFSSGTWKRRFASWSAVASAKARHRFERSQVAFAHLCNNHSPMSAGEKVSWPYAPTHRLLEGGAYFVTAVTYEKQHRFRGKERLSWLHDNLLQCCLNYGWRL
jgi:hypothetical protein